MKTKYYQIVRIIGKLGKATANVQVMRRVKFTTLASAYEGCRLAAAMHGGAWHVMLETDTEVQFWLDAAARKEHCDNKSTAMRRSRKAKAA